MSAPTFRQYLGDRIADLTKDDFDLDSDDLSRQFVNDISHYGFGLDDVIPERFEEILTHDL